MPKLRRTGVRPLGQAALISSVIVVFVSGFLLSSDLGLPLAREKSFRRNILECSSTHRMTGFDRHLCVCGFGLVTWSTTSTQILLRQVLLN